MLEVNWEMLIVFLDDIYVNFLEEVLCVKGVDFSFWFLFEEWDFKWLGYFVEVV